MATESTDAADDRGQRRSSLVVGRLALYGLLAAIGLLALLDGVFKYLAFADGGIYNPVPYLLGVLVVLAVGFALLLAALAGTIAIGVERG